MASSVVKQTCKILIAGASADDYRTISAMIEAQKCATIMASGCSRTLELLESMPPDLVLADPAFLNGQARILAARCHSQGIPFVCLCGAGIDERKAALAMGCHDFIIKPLIEEELVFKLDQILNQGSALRAQQLPQASNLYERIFSSSILEHMELFFVVISLEGRLLWANPAMLKATGYQAEELIGREYLGALVPEEDHRSLSNVFEEMAIDEHMTVNINGVRTKDGGVIQVEWRGIPYMIGGQCYIVGIGTDVSERMRVERALQASESKYRSLVDNLNVGVYRNTAAGRGRWVQVNPAMARILGYDSVGELMKVNVEDVYETPADRMSYLAKIKGRGFVTNEELRLKKKDGTLVWGSITARAELDSKGDIVWMDGVLEDVNTRKQAEAMLERRTRELQESEAKYHSFFDGSRDAMLLIDGRRFVECNRAAVEMLGYPDAETMLGSHPGDLSPQFQEDGSSSFEKAEMILRDTALSGSKRFEWLHRRFDGSNIWVDVTITRIPYRDRVIFHTAWRDISERKAAEKAIRELNFYLRNVFDAMPSMLLGVDSELMITRWNKECEERTGIPLERAVGQKAWELLPEIVALQDEINLAMSEQSVRRLDRMPVHDQERQRFLEIVIYPLSKIQDGGAVIRIDDISERIALQEIVIQTEKMMTIGGLAAGMAHEINNPLSGIVQAVQNIERRLEPDKAANQAAAEAAGITMEALRGYLEKRQILQFLSGIRDGSHKASAIISNMLQFSRASFSVKERIDINELIDRAILLVANDYDLQKGYDIRKVEFERRYDPQLPLVLCSPVEIEQVMVNLFRNAVQAMTGIQERPAIQVQTARDGDKLQIVVSDNGAGMDEAVQNRIFEPFFTTKSPGSGTGLGLSVSRFIISSNHGGNMTVSSCPGQGTSFIISLPLDSPEMLQANP